MATATEVELLPEIGSETSRSRRREAALVSVILHGAVLLLLFVNPKFLHFLQAEPVPPAVAEEQARRQLTLLYIPSDLLKIPEPKKEELTSEERKRVVIRTPFTLDPRALRWALPTPVDPAPPRPPVPGAEPRSAEREAEGTKKSSEALEERRAEIARLENVPQPAGQPPNLELPMGTVGRSIEESLRAGAGQRGQQFAVPEGGLGSPLNTPYPAILSDTRGVDFGPYLTRLLYDVRKSWYAIIPEAARLGRKGRVVLVFAIRKDGSVPPDQPALVRSSDFIPYDRAALGAIRGAQPFPALPRQFTGEEIVLQFTFLYNLPLDYSEP